MPTILIVCTSSQKLIFKNLFLCLCMCIPCKQVCKPKYGHMEDRSTSVSSSIYLPLGIGYHDKPIDSCFAGLNNQQGS